MSESKTAMPEGMELKGNLSFARLNPMAGALAYKTDQPQLCGWIVGEAYAIQDSDPAVDRELYGPFRRIIGDFIAIPASNRSQRITATECFLPKIAERFIKAALDKGIPAVPLRYEGWAFPYVKDNKPIGPGYAYRVFVRQPPNTMSAAERMAIECGIIDAPALPPPQELGYDPESGEVDDSAVEPGSAAEAQDKRKAKAA